MDYYNELPSTRICAHHRNVFLTFFTAEYSSPENQNSLCLEELLNYVMLPISLWAESLAEEWGGLVALSVPNHLSESIPPVAIMKEWRDRLSAHGLREVRLV